MGESSEGMRERREQQSACVNKVAAMCTTAVTWCASSGRLSDCDVLRCLVVQKQSCSNGDEQRRGWRIDVAKHRLAGWREAHTLLCIGDAAVRLSAA